MVLVDGGATYTGGVVLSQPGTSDRRIQVIGVPVNGQRPILSGGNNTIEVTGDHVVVEGFEITGGTARCFFHHAHDVTLRDSVVRNCPAHGILGADLDSGSLTVHGVEVHHCGAGLLKHPIYIATDESAHPGSVFRLENSYIHDNATGGNGVKSRAERNEIYYNWIEGSRYRELELIGPDGQDPELVREDGDIVGNVFMKTANSESSDMVRVGGDGTGETSGRYRFVNNTFILPTGSSARAINLFDSIESLELSNNAFFRLGGGAMQVLRDAEASWADNGTAHIVGENNWVPTNSTGVPSQLTGTRSGANPGFANAAAFDFTPAAASSLVNTGSDSLAGFGGLGVPNALAATVMHPPRRAPVAPGSEAPRPRVGVIDIGAFEASAP